MFPKIRSLPVLIAALLSMVPAAAGADVKRCISLQGKSLFTDDACPPGYASRPLNPDASLSVVDAHQDRVRDSGYENRRPQALSTAPPVVYTAPVAVCPQLFGAKRAVHWRLMNNRAKPNDLTRLRDLEREIAHRACKDD